MQISRYEVKQRMSRAVIHGSTIYLCGQVGKDFDADISNQTITMLEKIDDLLDSVGSNRNRLLSVTLYLANIKDFDAVNEVWDAWVPEGKPPARTCVEAKMARPDILIEATVTAALIES